MQRLVLFDIDGTLLSAGGSGKRALAAALMEVFGTTGPIDAYSFAGRTDPQIVRALLSGTVEDPREIDARLPALWSEYLGHLEREIAGVRVEPLPGVADLVDRLDSAGNGVVLGLLTGNIVEGARIKLEAAGLGYERFAVGAFGSDHADRPSLPAIAERRARERTGRSYRGKDIVIIGDTPFDIECGAHLGVRTIATATGAHSEAELAACAPDHLFPTLADLDAVLEAILHD